MSSQSPSRLNVSKRTPLSLRQTARGDPNRLIAFAALIVCLEAAGGGQNVAPLGRCLTFQPLEGPK